jgi:hypothetical protein
MAEMDEKIYRLFIGQKNYMDDNKTLASLEQFMMTPDFYDKIQITVPSDKTIETNDLDKTKDIIETKDTTNAKDTTKDIIETKDTTKIPTPDSVRNYHFYPKSKDCIFMCVYVAIYGEQVLHQKGVNITNMIMNEKKLISDHCNSSPGVLKMSNYKLTIVKMNEIRCELMTQPFMNKIGGGLVACSIYYKRPIYVVCEDIGSYLRFVSKEYVDDEGETDAIILRVEASRIYLDQSGKSADVRLKYMALPHFEKPMLGASNYKLDELANMYGRIMKGPAPNVKMSKTEYYEKILIRMSECVSAKLF